MAYILAFWAGVLLALLPWWVPVALLILFIMWGTYPWR